MKQGNLFKFHQFKVIFVFKLAASTRKSTWTSSTLSQTRFPYPQPPPPILQQSPNCTTHLNSNWKLFVDQKISQHYNQMEFHDYKCTFCKYTLQREKFSIKIRFTAPPQRHDANKIDIKKISNPLEIKIVRKKLKSIKITRLKWIKPEKKSTFAVVKSTPPWKIPWNFPQFSV